MPSSSSEEPLHLELKELALAVIKPLKSGLDSFNNVSEMLLRVNADIVLPESKSFHDIRQEIENMKERMEESEKVAISELLQLDVETERLTAEQSHLDQQKNEKELSIAELKTKLESDTALLKINQKALQNEKDHLKSAKDTRNKMSDKRNQGETIRNVGIGAFFIPFPLWVAAPIAIWYGEKERRDADAAVAIANKEVENSESQVTAYSKKVSEVESLMAQHRSEKKEAEDRIDQVEATLRSMAVKREAVANVQQKIRSAVHQLGMLSGVGNIAELQTRRQILMEPMVKIMEEMTTALGQIASNELLRTEGIISLVREIKEKQSKLNQLVASNGSDGEGYY